MTSYVILKKIVVGPNEGRSSPGDWLQGPTVEAVSAEAAIRKAVDGDKGGTFVAVPLRSFSEITVTVETQRKLTLA
jgi:hypothetical protein